MNGRSRPETPEMPGRLALWQSLKVINAAEIRARPVLGPVFPSRGLRLPNRSWRKLRGKALTH